MCICWSVKKKKKKIPLTSAAPKSTLSCSNFSTPIWFAVTAVKCLRGQTTAILCLFCQSHSKLFFLFTHNGKFPHSSENIIKIAHNAALIDCITDGDESSFGGVVRDLRLDNNPFDISKEGDKPRQQEGIDGVGFGRFGCNNVGKDHSWLHHQLMLSLRWFSAAYDEVQHWRQESFTDLPSRAAWRLIWHCRKPNQTIQVQVLCMGCR